MENHYNAINITSDGNILTYISSKGLFTNSINVEDHIKYKLDDNNEYLIVSNINMEASNISIIPEEKYYNGNYYPVKKIDIKLKDITEELTNKITHYIFVPDNIEDIKIVNDNINDNYILTLNVPYKSMNIKVMSSTDDNYINPINYQIVRNYSNNIISDYPILSNIINFTYFDNSYFITPFNIVLNTIEDVKDYIPSEDYDLWKTIEIARRKFYFDKQKLVYIKKAFKTNDLTIPKDKQINGLRFNNNNIYNIKNQSIKNISSTNTKITFNYQNVYYITDTGINKQPMNNSTITTVITKSDISHLSLFNDNIYYFVKSNSEGKYEQYDLFFNNDTESILTLPTYYEIQKIEDRDENDELILKDEIVYYPTTVYDMIYYKQYLIILTTSYHNDYAYDETYKRIDNYVKYITLFYSADGKYFQKEHLFNISLNSITSLSLTSNNDKLYLITNSETYEFNTFTVNEFLMRI